MYTRNSWTLIQTFFAVIQYPSKQISSQHQYQYTKPNIYWIDNIQTTIIKFMDMLKKC